MKNVSNLFYPFAAYRKAIQITNEEIQNSCCYQSLKAVLKLLYKNLKDM